MPRFFPVILPSSIYFLASFLRLPKLCPGEKKTLLGTRSWERDRRRFPLLSSYSRNSGAKLDATSESIFPTRHATTLNSVHSFPSIRIAVFNINDKLPVFRPPNQEFDKWESSVRRQFARRTFHTANASKVGARATKVCRVSPSASNSRRTFLGILKFLLMFQPGGERAALNEYRELSFPSSSLFLSLPVLLVNLPFMEYRLSSLTEFPPFPPLNTPPRTARLIHFPVDRAAKRTGAAGLMRSYFDFSTSPRAFSSPALLLIVSLDHV